MSLNNKEGLHEVDTTDDRETIHPFDWINEIVSDFLRKAPWAIGGALLLAIVIAAGTTF